MRLALVRHAETAEDTRGRCYGRGWTSGLSAVGREQCARARRRTCASPAARVWASPAVRARETAEAIAAPHRLDVGILERFGELDFGELEGRAYDEIAVSDPELYAEQWMKAPTAIRFPGGESYADLQARVDAGIAALMAQHDGGLIVVVTHGGVVRVVLRSVLGFPAERISGSPPGLPR